MDAQLTGNRREWMADRLSLDVVDELRGHAVFIVHVRQRL
jgi:hypothetical protein